MTTIADLLHAPVELLLAALQERQPRLNTIFNSPLVLPDPRNFANLALSTGATKVEIPLLTPVPGTYSLQNPGNPPPIAGIGSVRQVSAVTYREKAWGRDAFALAQSGLDPMSFIVDRILNVRFDEGEDVLLSSLQGIFGSTPYANLDLSAPNEDPVGTPASDQPFSTDLFYDTIGILGIKEDDLRGGVIFMHPKVRTFLKKLDEIDYVTPSSGTAFIETFKGMTIYVDNRLVRSGSTSGEVFPIYIAAPQTIVYNIATQSTDGTESSSLAFVDDVPGLQKALYDRVVGICHVNGAIWSPGAVTIAPAGPDNPQLAAPTWETAYQDVRETRIVRMEVNV